MALKTPSVSSLALERGLIFGAVLLPMLWAVSHRQGPYLFHDEYGVLGAAGYLSGLSWSTPSDMPFYGFGLALLVLPVELLTQQPNLVYRAALTCNAVLMALSGLLAHGVLLRAVPAMRPFFRVAIVLTSLAYPAVAFYAGLALGETALFFVLWGLTYCLLCFLDELSSRPVLAACTGTLLALAPYAHSRGLVFVLPFLLFIGWAWWAHRLNRRNVAIFLLAWLAVLTVLVGLKQALTSGFYSSHWARNDSAVSFVASKLTSLSLDELKIYALIAWGQLTYLTTSSFGLVGLLPFALWHALNRARLTMFDRRHSPGGDALCEPWVLLACWAVAVAALMFVASVMQLGIAERADHYFYGRYNEVVLPLVIAMVLMWLMEMTGVETTRAGRSSRLWRVWAVSGGGLLALAALVPVAFFPAGVWKLPMFWNSISSWFVHIHEAWVIEPQRIAQSTAVALTLLCLAFGLSRRAGLLCLALFFFNATVANYREQHAGGDRGWHAIHHLPPELRQFLAGRVVFASSSWPASVHGVALQLAAPEARVVFNASPMGDGLVLASEAKECDTQSTLAHFNGMALCGLSPSADVLRYVREHNQKPKDARKPPAPDISLSTESLQVGGMLQRACAALSSYFYGGWAAACLPSVSVALRGASYPGGSAASLGSYISDGAGVWLAQWREPLDHAALAHGRHSEHNVRVRFPYQLPPGTYSLHFAVVDDVGWDWRTRQSIRLIVR